MPSLRFPDAAVIKDNHFIMNISAEKLAHIQNSKISLFEREFRNNLYCPECHRAKLFLRNGTEKIAHFSQFKDSLHDENCSLNYKRVPSHKLKEIYANNPTEIDIHDKLNKVIALFFREENTATNPLVLNKKIKNNKNNTYANNATGETIRKASIPRRLITAIRTEDLSEIKIFYGDVYIKWDKVENNDNRDFWNLRIYKEWDEQEKKFRYLCCSIVVSNSVYNWLSNEYKNNQHCYIAFFGEMQEKKANGKTYINASLKHSDFISIETLKLI